MFHVELRQFPHQARAFNLTREELEERIVRPWVRGAPVELEERRWDPRKAKLSIYEGRELEATELGLGRGWGMVTKTGSEVTENVIAAARPPALTRERLDALSAELSARGAKTPLTLAEAVAVATGAGLGEQAEPAVWLLLREGRLGLTARGENS